MRDIDYGTVRIKLNELIEQQGISKNRLAHVSYVISVSLEFKRVEFFPFSEVFILYPP